MKFLMKAIGIVCVATVLTQMIILGVFAVRGTLNAGTGTKILALINGIDITGNQLQKFFAEGEDREQPDFDEILEARQRESLDICLLYTSPSPRDLSTSRMPSSA